MNPVYFSEKLEGRTDGELERIGKKLHMQFSHCSSKRLIKLLENSGIRNKKFFRKYSKIQEFLKSRKKAGSVGKNFKKAGIPAFAGRVASLIEGE